MSESSHNHALRDGSEPSTEAQSARQSAHQSAPRILIAEDDRLQGAILRSALEGRGYTADIVTDGLEAVRRLRTGRYDLALLDYHMPEVDGLAAARLLHDFLPGDTRPRLIAITAAADGLCEREEYRGGTSFDAVVSKNSGLSALLTVIDANLTGVAELHVAAMLEQGRQAARQAGALRRRRLFAPLAAIPALGMVAAFIAAFVWARASLHDVDGAIGSAQRTAMLSTDAAALVGAVQDAEVSQRTYLATGQDVHREQFETDAQHVDQLLASSVPLAADGMPGLGEAAAPQTVIEPRLRALTMEAQARSAAGASVPALGSSPESGRDAAEQLRAWAASVVGGSQQAVLQGLSAVSRHIEPVLVVLITGILYGLWAAVMAVLRRWRAPALGLQPADMWRRPLPPSRGSSPLILQDGTVGTEIG